VSLPTEESAASETALVEGVDDLRIKEDSIRIKIANGLSDGEPGFGSFFTHPCAIHYTALNTKRQAQSPSK
jgi:hypothetical protein